MRQDTEPAWDYAGNYITDVYTEHAVNTIQNHDTSKPLFLMVTHVAPHGGNVGKLLEAPQSRINRFKYIIDSNRRTYAGKFCFYFSVSLVFSQNNIRNN